MSSQGLVRIFSRDLTSKYWCSDSADSLSFCFLSQARQALQSAFEPSLLFHKKQNNSLGLFLSRPSHTGNRNRSVKLLPVWLFIGIHSDCCLQLGLFRFYSYTRRWCFDSFQNDEQWQLQLRVSWFKHIPSSGIVTLQLQKSTTNTCLNWLFCLSTFFSVCFSIFLDTKKSKIDRSPVASHPTGSFRRSWCRDNDNFHLGIPLAFWTKLGCFASECCMHVHNNYIYIYIYSDKFIN